jgi:hypothetical protein
VLEVNLLFSCQFSPLSFLLPQAHLLHLTTVVCSFLALPRVLFIDVTPSEEMQEWRIYPGWFVTLVSRLVPTWVHKLADLCTNPIGKLFSARDRTPEVTVTSLPCPQHNCSRSGRLCSWACRKATSRWYGLLLALRRFSGKPGMASTSFSNKALPTRQPAQSTWRLPLSLRRITADLQH